MVTKKFIRNLKKTEQMKVREIVEALKAYELGKGKSLKQIRKELGT
ncbi:hypothetical protein HYT23_06935 [Candidatus Pacearchaeota archaeon]|nr:hypothetical protein [Candidatus Pacearchaeota archaeon]